MLDAAGKVQEHLAGVAGRGGLRRQPVKNYAVMMLNNSERTPFQTVANFRRSPIVAGRTETHRARASFAACSLWIFRAAASHRSIKISASMGVLLTLPTLTLAQPDKFNTKGLYQISPTLCTRCDGDHSDALFYGAGWLCAGLSPVAGPRRKGKPRPEGWG